MKVELTKENYKTNHDYMSYSTFSLYLTCEAAAAAHYRAPSTTAQLVGSYVDAYFSNELEEFKAEHPEIFNIKTGALKADFVKANDIIARIESDETFLKTLSGEKQVIMTGKINGLEGLDNEIEGLPFKIKMDSYKENEFIVDLKVMKDFKPVWSDAYHSYQNFMIAYNYDIEMAIFQEIVYQNTGKKLPVYISAITKEDPSDIGIFSIPQNKLDEALTIVKHNIPRIKKILNGEVAPHRCETCEYCKMTKKARVLDWDYVGYSGDKLREEGIECDDPKLVKKEDNEDGKD